MYVKSLNNQLYTLYRTMSQRAPTAPNAFLNGPNYQKVVGFLRQHYTSKLGTNALPERMEGRLQKTVQHYMTEVSRIQGSKPVQQLNQEVVRETVSSIDTWLKKQETNLTPTTTTIGTLSRGDTDYAKLFSDTGSRYEQLLAERAPIATSIPATPDFTLGNTMLESEEDPVVLMERMAKQREDQARALGITSPPKLEIREEAPPSSAAPVPPQAEAAPPQLAPRPQDYIIPQEDVQKYRETEYNVFLTSSDRDWLRNTSENRYNFTVNFNARSTRNGAFNYNASLQNRFRNIQRIEFVKAIVPIEALNPLVRVASIDGATATYDVNRVINVFSLPFLGVRIQELENNGFSTTIDEDSTFAMVQYDTFWSSDLVAQNVNGTAPVPVLTKSGYTGLIPKFLKTQKIYTPTPLATLQRLSVRLERHNKDLVSTDSDVQSVNKIFLSSHLSTLAASTSLYNSVFVSNPQNAYIFINTGKYFSFSAVAEGDNIQIQGYVTGFITPAASDLEAYINRSSGHYVVAVGNTTGGDYEDGRNAAGYCNVIIIRNRFDDPTNGSVGRTSSYLGGTDANEDVLSAALDNVSTAAQTSCALINLSRQVHVVLRIVTRDVDSSANIRPDNV